MSQYIGKKGTLRFYDATGGTKLYIILKFVNMDAVIPEGHARVEELLRLNRGVLDTSGHYVQGLDDAILEPIPVTFSFLLDTGSKDLVQEFIGLRFASGEQATWEAGITPSPLVTTKGTSTGLIPGLTTSLVALPAFSDAKKVCVDIEVLWDEGANDQGRKITEVWFPPAEQTMNEAADGVTINLNGQAYGAVTALTTFTAGTEVVQ